MRSQEEAKSVDRLRGPDRVHPGMEGDRQVEPGSGPSLAEATCYLGNDTVSVS